MAVGRIEQFVVLFTMYAWLERTAWMWGGVDAELSLG